MRKFKFVVILAVVSVLTLGIYTVFIQSIEESDFTVETIKGNPKQPEVRSIQAELYDNGLKDVDYNVELDGHVQKKTNNFISDLFENPSEEKRAPADFRRFIRSDYVTMLKQDGISYAMGAPDNTKWELQYWEEGKQRVVKKIFPAPVEARKLGETQITPYKKIGDSLYVTIYDLQTEVGTQLYKIDLKGDSIQKINLSVSSQDEISLLGIHNEVIVYYVMENINGTDISKEKLYMSNGKTTKRLKGLKSFSNGQTELSADGSKLIVLEREMNDFNWTVYDIKTKQVEKHSMDIPLVTDEFGLGEYTTLKDGLIYTANRLNDGIYNVRVIDPLSDRILYEGNIKDKLKREETSLNGLVLK
ncbi:hypothetical protein HNY42_07580 [Exiguobacterium sp. Helios]|uniref:hypothetical protein n=1 Tax=Exiguobacterium sp. Helios TaxID=2735868 RepID=UPI00103A7FFE|nr:hypothetical protein [Exiguobacterium sp. Helios]QNR20801.1 hypothetical protein HNY42_07580 [Exiguobacterium sp. Helios]